jgi:anti-sigma-K factor RskA
MAMREMDLKRFAAIVESYGARPERWPEADRAAAEALLRVSAEAQALLDAARPMDRLLDAVPTLAPTPDLRAAILASALRPPRVSLAMCLADAWRELFGELGGWRAAGTVLAASLVLGVLAGGLLSGGTSADSSPDLLQLALLDNSMPEY